MNAIFANLTLVIAVLAVMAFVALHPWTFRYPWVVRTLMVVATGSVLGILTYFTLWIPSISLEFSATVNTAEQEPGVVIGGINWLPAYGLVRIDIRNGSNFDVSSLDIVVKVDQPVTAAGQLTNMTGVSIEPHDLPIIDPQWFHPGGRRVAIPIVALATERGYRVRSSIVPRHGSISVVIATVAPNDGAAKNDRDNLLKISFIDGRSVWFAHEKHSGAVFASRPTIRNIVITGQYEVNDREHTVSEQLHVVADPLELLPLSSGLTGIFWSEDKR